MLITDNIYGQFNIKDKVLQKLIMSEPIQRLKWIHQGGANYLVNKKWNVTRYEHSIGVMLLIRKLGGTVEEQIAGLLHDVSHTAFSHVVDYVFENELEDYHEKIFKDVVDDSEIPDLLARFNYNYKEIIDDSNWSILEQPAPALCADRIDYTLRDMYEYGYISLENVQRFLDNLIVYKGKIYLKDIKISEWFVETYYKEVIDFFMNPLCIYANYMLAECLKEALKKGEITPTDFLSTDNELLKKIYETQDPKLVSILERIRPNIRLRINQKDYDIYQKNKVRIINPLILRDGKSYFSTDLSEDVKRMSNQAHHIATQGIYLTIC
ncbi:HD domain-containing protein [Viridibacillus arvi]|uniref:HD domain-containing protein n=1 Tax=Viridibacillus arvi TaxID=263475 RepID=UPI00187B226F|nr:HD domain-containing protein [Viridibacillus sp. JNUCC-6]QOV11975.1 HD domain-containing protein [Viridibacillus sp. JNUCC-6]